MRIGVTNAGMSSPSFGCLAVLALAVLAAPGCGGSEAKPVVITPDNIDDLALSATDVVTRAAVSQTVSSGLFGLSAMPATGSEQVHMEDVANPLDMSRVTPVDLTIGAGASPMRPIPYLREDDPQRSQIYVADPRPIVTDDGAQSSAVPSAGGAGDPFGICESGGATLDGRTLTFTGCDVAGVCIFDGKARLSISDDQNSFAMRFTGLEVTCDDYQPLVLDGDRLSCSGLRFGALSCEYDITRFKGALTGVRFTVRSMDLVGDIETSFGIDATIVDPDYGLLSIDTLQPITFETCPYEVPSGGMVSIDGAPPSSGTVEFLGCEDYEVCFYADDVLPPICNTRAWASFFEAP